MALFDFIAKVNTTKVKTSEIKSHRTVFFHIYKAVHYLNNS